MNTIRVAMIIQAYHPHVGGAERQLAAISPRLQRQGVDVHVLTRQQPGLPRYELINGIPVHRIPTPGNQALASLSFTTLALPLLTYLRPNLIHAHEMLSPTTTAVFAKRILKVPIITKVLRGGDLGDIAYLQSHKTGRQRLATFRQDVDRFIAISQEIDRELESMGVAPNRRVLIPNGVNTQHYAPVTLGEKLALRHKLGLPNGPIAVFTGRLSPEKRVEHLLAIWPLLREQHPDASLLILGSGPDEPGLHGQASPGVHLLGRVNDVAPYLKAADLFLLPSHTEGLSNALLEAMSTALPCIATRVGGAIDLIDHASNGWLVNRNAPDEMLAAISLLLENPAQRYYLGQRARQHIVRGYSLGNTAERINQLYQGLLAERPLTAVQPTQG